ncbi:hypothetical protein [Herbaspirillum rubrisubalbicans]|uniref:hypothetical protein n=1 Tax=Herbaspirillum rubrisubalbicans TaxID=80842 RepID=UPI0011BF8514|nr:hypothetical protein [Herbaspirillum rubrisubalbicans]
MNIAPQILSAAFCRAFVKIEVRPEVKGYSDYQCVEFFISWDSNDLQGVEIGDIFRASDDLFESTQKGRAGVIKVFSGYGDHGVCVRVTLPYPFPRYIIGAKKNKLFAINLALNDIARSLHLVRPTRETEMMLSSYPDPSAWWSRKWRDFVFSSERKRIVKEQRENEENRKRRQRDFS